MTQEVIARQVCGQHQIALGAYDECRSVIVRVWKAGRVYGGREKNEPTYMVFLTRCEHRDAAAATVSDDMRGIRQILLCPKNELGA